MWNNQGGFDGSYGSSSMGGGGGYTQSPGGFGSQSATQGDKKSRSRSQQIVPCTVSQLLSASVVAEVFHIGEVELSQVTVVGVIRHAEKAPTNIMYKVDDMTAAPMDVRQWVDTDEGSSENVVLTPGSYVKVAGHLRSFQNTKSLVAFKILPLEDMNEFTSHMLDVVHSHMALSKSQGTSMTGGTSAPKTPGSTGIGDMGRGYTGGGDATIHGLTAHQAQVLNLIKSCHGAEGMSFDELKMKLQGLNMTTIKDAVEFLSNEGHIYSTVDDEHYKSTDAD
ncbi:replication protein A 32 kDa subunit [Ambystoma mexicanum]|uniref:replication protein A 32 kDa subunit n=1 Tax=Ambystoma mexicanum TaxID=8296 RepID=UPI0037E93B3C